MILVKGQVYYTIIDLAKKLGVSAKTIREYLRKGIIPEPPVFRYGMRIVKYFPVEYMADVQSILESYRKGKNSGTSSARIAK